MGEKVLACGTSQGILAGAKKEHTDEMARAVAIGQGNVIIAEKKVINLTAKWVEIEIPSFVSLFKRGF